MKNNQSKFKLLQYFSLTSLIAFVLSLILFGKFYRDQSLKHFISLGEETNVALAKSLTNSLWLELSPLLTDTKSLTTAQLQNHPQAVLLDQAIQSHIQGLSVITVKIYDLSGKTVFSTDKSQNRQNKSWGQGFLAAKTGRVLTQLDNQRTSKTIAGNINHRDLLSSYIPIYSQDNPAKIAGVLELYNDVTPLIERRKITQRNIMLGAASILGLLYLALFGIVKRADRIIGIKHRTLKQSKTKYKQQAKLEAIAADQKQTIANITHKIRRSQDIETIFKITTQEIRTTLNSDRVIIYQFNPDWTGQIVAESVSGGWVSLLVEQNRNEVIGNDHLKQDRCLLRDWLQGQKADIAETDSFFQETQGGKYSEGQKFTAVDNIYTQNFDECYLKSLEKYQAQAYLIVPIFLDSKKLWGLLGTYQNDNPRVWQDSEIDLMQKIVNQLAIALQQSEYIDQLKNQTRNLEITVKELTLAQQHLIQQEKLAALGQLIAGVAHEINTPLGAIQASAGNNAKALIEVIAELPQLSKHLSEQEIDIFFQLLDRVIMSKPFFSSSEKRPLKRQILKQLKEQKIDNARNIADLLIDIGIYNKIDFSLPLLKHTQVDWILDLAYNLTRLFVNNQNIINSVEKAAKVVFALKNYAHFDTSGQKKLLNVKDGLETVLEIYHNQLKRNINVLRDYQDIPKIWGYPDELIQVWTNLIHNGIQAMGEQGQLVISTKTENDGVKVIISDSGHGISTEIQNKIFEPFFTTKAIGEGSGLGLSISKNIVDKHQGIIAVESKPGQTIFSIWLPINQDSNKQPTISKQLTQN
ncbi:signal transduction histidine kinase, nitrogen specific [Xenococcus sp. PCC 7305]|uniref:GAF domain-containing sensor histidine kinase n=1 Tax=Xenococcus sp. PCC 7305 TaxID=102125 RepID=UPI0002AC7248|nr:sensor histidine kinase [Xenococcus sp. PCC 7305]ELS00832.1 signal transduction histidine kinase, nitrogen specific [Xenococcus sp. PCC 7305]